MASGALPLQLLQTFADDLAGALNVRGRMRRRNEAGFKLRRCEIDPALQAAVKKFCEHFQIAPLGAIKIDNWAAGKEQTEHRADSMKRDVDLGPRDGISRRFLKLRPEVLQ